MKPVTLIFLLIISFSNSILAQKQAALWILDNYKISFQSGSFEVKDYNSTSYYNASICNEEGELVLYSDGVSIWNANDEILINGTELIGNGYVIISQPIFVPYPKNEGKYFLFYQYANKGGYRIQDIKLVYAEIDCNAYNGKGKVIVKNEFLHDDFHSEPTVAGFCNNSYYWLAIDRDDNIHEPERDRVYFYKIDENGVNKTPKIDDHFDMGSSSGYKFSPNGDKLYFFYGGNSSSELRNVIADFNFLTGELYNYRSLGLDVNWHQEFSPNSKYFYYFSGRKLMQLNASNTLVGRINKSISNILDLPVVEESEYNGWNLQLAPDGKIYFTYTDPIDQKQKLGRINQPNNQGLACNPELDLYTFDRSFAPFPNLVCSFFRDIKPKILDEEFPDAGPGLEICSKTSGILGAGIQHPEVQYHWQPENFIEDPFSVQTEIKAPLQKVTTATKNYTLRATDGNCWINFDQTIVKILPQPETPTIDGSWSVCPYVELVDYWIKEENIDAEWFVSGGEIGESNSEDSVKINWWDTNSNASVKAYQTNNYGCVSDTGEFPVRINVELITETPNGLDKLCLAEGKEVVYQIRNTNGSVYDWYVEGGEINSGQGTNRVLVNWKIPGVHSLFVEETSLTIDTICFGESAPLIVEILNDSLDINLKDVSYTSVNSIKLNYQSDKLNLSKHYLQLEIKDEFGEFISEEPTTGTYFRKDEAYYSEILRLKVTNLCDEVFYSEPQQTIVLKGHEIFNSNTILLSWNLNQFWMNDRITHEIWHSTKNGNDWQIVATVDAVTDYNFEFEGLSLNHSFRIKEINQDKNSTSWSNTINIEIDDEIFIPDVFTPNGDGFNDLWQIDNIQFHTIQKVEVFTRFGQKVYECKNEFIPWDGKINGEIIQGTYLYQVTLNSDNIKHGQLTIIQ